MNKRIKGRAQVIQVVPFLFVRDRDQFSYIAVFYNNLEDVILPVMQTDQVTDAAKQELLSELMPVMQEQAQETRDIIHRHIMPEEEEFGSPFDLWESRQSSLTVGRFAVLGRLAGRYGAGR